jgi:hypothetical protein
MKTLIILKETGVSMKAIVMFTDRHLQCSPAETQGQP